MNNTTRQHKLVAANTWPQPDSTATRRRWLGSAALAGKRGRLKGKGEGRFKVDKETMSLSMSHAFWCHRGEKNVTTTTPLLAPFRYS